MAFKHAYISGALTYSQRSDNVDIRDVYEKLGELCEKHGVTAFVPHLVTDPKDNPEVPAETVWAKDKQEVENSDIVIAYGGMPSLGTGAELEIARIANVPIVLWWFKDEPVSRMARGNPGVMHTLEVKTPDELLEKLDEILRV